MLDARLHAQRLSGCVYIWGPGRFECGSPQFSIRKEESREDQKLSSFFRISALALFGC